MILNNQLKFIKYQNYSKVYGDVKWGFGILVDFERGWSKHREVLVPTGLFASFYNGIAIMWSVIHCCKIELSAAGISAVYGVRWSSEQWFVHTMESNYSLFKCSTKDVNEDDWAKPSDKSFCALLDVYAPLCPTWILNNRKERRRKNSEEVKYK